MSVFKKWCFFASLSLQTGGPLCYQLVCGLSSIGMESHTEKQKVDGKVFDRILVIRDIKLQGLSVKPDDTDFKVCKIRSILKFGMLLNHKVVDTKSYQIYPNLNRSCTRTTASFLWRRFESSKAVGENRVLSKAGLRSQLEWVHPEISFALWWFLISAFETDNSHCNASGLADSCAVTKALPWPRIVTCTLHQWLSHTVILCSIPYCLQIIRHYIILHPMIEAIFFIYTLLPGSGQSKTIHVGFHSFHSHRWVPEVSREAQEVGCFVSTPNTTTFS